MPNTKRDEFEQPDARIVFTQREYRKEVDTTDSGDMFDDDQEYEPGANI